MPSDHTPIDFARLADALLQRAEYWVQQWLPGGRREGHEWCEASTANGGLGDSLKVNLNTGRWAHFASNESGGDLTSLYAYLHNVDNGRAARELMSQLGWDDRDEGVQAPAPSSSAEASIDHRPEPPPGEEGVTPKRSKSESKWVAVTPVPPHAPRPGFTFGFRDRSKPGSPWVELDAVRTWEYRFEGQLYGYVARFERVDSKGDLVKDTVARTWCEDTSDGNRTQRWHWKSWEAPRPLYVPATLLAGDPASVPVVVVEGEKCAEAGHQLLGHEFDFVSWPGGAKAWAKAHWGWLMGRTVYLWPDCDAKRQRLTREERENGVDPNTKPIEAEHRQPGMQAMVGIGTMLLADQACTVYLCKIPEPGEKPDGWDIADAIAEGWDAARVRDFIRSARTFVPSADEARAKAAASTPTSAGADNGGDDDGADEDTSWKRYLIKSGSGAIKPVRENLVLALDGVKHSFKDEWIPGIPEAVGLIAFNEFSNDIEKLRPTPWGTGVGPWEEQDELEMGNWLTRQHWLPSMPRGTLEEAVTMVAKRHRFHPVRQRLEGLRGTWDHEPRLRHWLRTCCMEEDEVDPEQQEYLARVGTWLVMAICARVMRPGCKFDYMVIFEGKQGRGKSTLAQLLALGHFADTGLVLGDKDSYQNIQGVLVYEWGELDAMSKSEVTRVKQFVSSQKDRFRASFDRRPKDYPRQVVFIGTTNEGRYLIDTTGNRRFWPVHVTRQVDVAWFREHVDQLFAEALAYLDAGERFYPTPAEQTRLFDPQQGQRQVENAIESAIRRYLYDESQHVSASGLNGALVEEVTVSGLLASIGISIDKQSAVIVRQASAALRSLGWTLHRSSKTDRPWVYRRPAYTPPPPPAARAGASQSSTEDVDAPPF